VIAGEVLRKKILVRGECSGSIALSARGRSGFGFDPVFIPEGGTRTLAQMTSEEKNAISHRGRSIRLMLRRLPIAGKSHK